VRIGRDDRRLHCHLEVNRKWLALAFGNRDLYESVRRRWSAYADAGDRGEELRAIEERLADASDFRALAAAGYRTGGIEASELEILVADCSAPLALRAAAATALDGRGGGSRAGERRALSRLVHASAASDRHSGYSGGMRWAVIGIAFLVQGCGARSELPLTDRDDPGRRPEPEPEPEPRPLPPAPPACAEVAYDACVAWGAPVVVSRPEDGRTLRPDVAWFDRIHVVTYEVIDEEEIRVATVDAAGEILWNESAGDSETPRIAFNPQHGRGLVTTSSGARWIGSDGVPLGSFASTDPSNTSSDRIAHDVFATPGGFGIIVAPTSDPGHSSLGVYGAAPASPGTVSWGVYADDNAGPALEHATGADGLVHRFVVEIDFEVLLYEWDGAPVGPVAPGYDLGGSTTFNDGLVTDGAKSFVQRASNSVMVFLELSADGGQEVHQLMLDDFQTSGPHVERLGTANGLRDIVVADRRIDSRGMAVARFEPASSVLSAPIVIGPDGRRPRLARTSRGLAVTWVDEATGEVLLNVLDCCTADG
jgi:hypothetical protein